MVHVTTKDEEAALAARIAALENAQTMAAGADTAAGAPTVQALAASTLRLEMPVNPTSTLRGNLVEGGGNSPARSDGSSLGALPHIVVTEKTTISKRPSGPTSPDLAVTATLGEGGMGRVHLAHQRSLDRDVAVKTLKPEADWSAGIALAREARITGFLEHPGVIPVHAFGADDDGRPLLVMKRVEGTDLLSLIGDPSHPIWAERSAGKQDLLAAKLELLIQICRTVEFSHARGIIHRDIKPENVMVGSYGEVYLLDWGIALRTSEAARPGLFGTPAYMAPEMFTGGAIDERTDVYLLGATLHHMLTGTFRHEGDGLMAIGRSAIASAPVTYPADVPPALAAIANRATARLPADRFQSVQELRESLLEVLHDRAAYALSVAANERLTALRELLAKAGTSAPQDLATAYRLATEARFGFAQSLREHPKQREAIVGARDALVALCELELLQGHADTAEALLRELATPEPALLARVAEVRALEAEKARDRERLAAMDQARDPRVGLRARNVITAVFALGIILISIRFGPGNVVLADPWTPVRVDLALLALVLVPSVILRKRLFGNAYSRQVAGVVFVVITLTLTSRVACALRGTADLSQVLLTDMWIATSAVSVAAVMLNRALWASAFVLLVGGMTMRLAPQVSGVFSIATLVATLVFGVVLWRRARARA